jgi:hypothetical protein
VRHVAQVQAAHVEDVLDGGRVGGVGAHPGPACVGVCVCGGGVRCGVCGAVWCVRVGGGGGGCQRGGMGVVAV